VLCPLAALGGRTAVAAAIFAIASLLLALAIRPAILDGASFRTLDALLLGIAVAIASQIIPLPSAIVGFVSPHATALVERIWLISTPSAWPSLSIDRASTLWAGMIVVGAFALFFTARTVVSRGGLRRTVRGVSALGFLFSALAIAQAATAGRLIYWRFPTEHEGPLPFGPFVNRNHFATWVIMAAPLCLGYIIARAAGSEGTTGEFMNRRARIARLADGRMLWLTAAATLMVVALLASLSRSGIAALIGAFVVLCAAQRKRSSLRRAWWILALVALVVGFALSRADLSAVAGRFAESRTGVRDRLRIWNDTVPMVEDFWLFGTGAGTYRTAMLYYQRGDRTVQFNQAHNHYLQIAAEGGVVLAILVGAALVALAAAVRKQLDVDSSGTFWLRAGAACGLLAVALQSVWETGLVMPANAALAAVLAAIATHER
jgi:O-antigen ligase